MKIAGVILAGGGGTRLMGANKALLMLGDRPLVAHVSERLASQVAVLGINANRDIEAFNLPIVPDGIGGSLGPLDGILGAMLFAQQNRCTHTLTVSVDTPFIPLDLGEKLFNKASKLIAIATSHNRVHGTCGLWPITQIAGLKAFIVSGKSLKLMDYLYVAGFIELPFEGASPDPFFNINTPDDLAVAARWL
jgi:molybdenum cofactor guanylyltransferase